MLEEFLMNSDGLVVTDSTWTYKIPTVDTIPRQFNVEILNSGQHKNRVLSSKGNLLIYFFSLLLKPKRSKTQKSLFKTSVLVSIQLRVNRHCF